MYGKIPHRRVLLYWIIIFLLGCGFYFCVCLNLGGVSYFSWIPHVCQSTACLSGQEFYHTFGECLSFLKHHSEAKEESVDSIGLCLSSFLKDWANLSVNLSVLIYNSTPVGFIPAPLPSNWHVNENARATPPPWVIGILRHCCYLLFKGSLEMPSIDPFLYAIF